jgi:hypothetical protein
LSSFALFGGVKAHSSSSRVFFFFFFFVCARVCFVRSSCPLIEYFCPQIF